jgi:hypothetical protein
VNKRLLNARFKSKFTRLTIIQCYAPRNVGNDEAKNKLYTLLDEHVKKVPKLQYFSEHLDFADDV